MVSDEAEFLYKCSDFYDPASEHGVHWSDPQLVIDWGVSEPLAVVYAGMEMRRRGHSFEEVDRMIYQNPMRFLSQSPKFLLPGVSS